MKRISNYIIFTLFAALLISNDYSLTEISRLVESEDLKILSISVDADAARRTLQLTLKLNKTNIKHIVATFERFNYKVLSTFMEEEQTDSLKDRYDILMKYLNL